MHSTSRMRPRLLLWGLSVLLLLLPTAQGFVGLTATKCNLDPSKGEINDPCGSLYDGVCRGSRCGCGSGYREDPNLRRCVPGTAPGGGGGGAFDDLPFDFPGPDDKSPAQPQPQPRPPVQPQPQPPVQPQPQPRPPVQPQPQPPRPQYPTGPQPGYPEQPRSPQYPGTKGHGDGNVGEKAGGGVGGVVGLLLIGGIIYFCCCRGGKHKQVMNRFQGLPFMRGGGQTVQMQHQTPMMQQDPNFASQHTYIPPEAQGVPPGMPPPQQPYPPPPQQPYPAGYPAEGQQPPPYSQQYQPTAPQ